MADKELVLGLDLGVRSVGWALVEFAGEDPCGLVAAGTRIFEAGVEGDVERGKEESKAKARRLMRMQRRQFDRRSRRDRTLALLLQRAGLLPAGDLGTGAGRHALWVALDRDLFNKYAAGVAEEERHRVANVFPYWLRARALETKLELHELGRAIYHLGQRRGFLSNRKAGKQDEEKSVVYQGISELKQAIEGTGSRSLGDYFSRLSPTDFEPTRIRGRWTHRDMFAREFERIWEAQALHWPEVLTKALKKRVRKAIFYQRPLKSAKELVGECRFETAARTGRRARKRCPMSDELAQHFRMWQTINHLRIETPDGEERPLDDEQRRLLFDALDREGDLTMAGARKVVKAAKGEKFTIEKGGEKSLRGNRVRGKLRAVFGEAWDHFPADKRAGLIQDLRSYERSEALAKRARKHWAMDPVTAEKFSQLELEPGYSALSRQAIQKLLPHLEAGKSYGDAVYAVYQVWPNAEDGGPGRGTPLTLTGLPPVDHSPLGDLRNPAVHRVLSELRKVVNALIKKHGKPDKVRIELARDLRNTKKDREKISKKMREREGERDEARAEIEGSAQVSIQNPRRGDIERFLLWKECGGVCPYTGKTISMAALYGAQFDVEHIIPYSISLDNSFANKTLCYHEVNRTEKRNKTPWQAFGHDKERYEAMVERVKRFSGEAAKKKLWRFTMDGEELEKFLSNFNASQLQDTRYATKLAAKYCRQLYQDDDSNTLRVQGTNGSITAELRRHWQMSKILGGGEKTRDDHRHHAVDAIAVALTTPKVVKRVSDAAVKNVERGLRLGKDAPPPWDGFLDDCIRVVEGIVVSHAVYNRVRGPLHKQTIFGWPRQDEEGATYHTKRVSVADLSWEDVQEPDAPGAGAADGKKKKVKPVIVPDKAVRKAIRERLDALGAKDGSKVFADAANHPFLVAKDGRKIPIHKVKIRVNDRPFPVGQGEHARYVLAAENHHTEIVETRNKKGEPVWEDFPVSLLEATRRKMAGEPIVKRDHGPGTRLVMSLAAGEIIGIPRNDREYDYFVIRGISKKDITYVRLSDARLKGDIQDTGDWGRFQSMNTLRDSGVSKFWIDVLGRVFPCEKRWRSVDD